MADGGRQKAEAGKADGRTEYGSGLRSQFPLPSNIDFHLSRSRISALTSNFSPLILQDFL